MNLQYPIVWGGNHPTCLPDECLSESFVDYVVTEDGEAAVVTLANDLLAGQRLNIRHRKGIITDLDDFTPTWHLVNLSDYLFDASHSVRGRIDNSGTKRIFYYLSTSRGCPYRCAFCYNSRTPKLPWRGHSSHWVIEQIKLLRRETNLDGIGFWDDFFLGHWRRAEEIVGYLRKEDIKFLCEVRAAHLREDTVEWLKGSGCLQVFVGAESGSDRVLKMIDKRIQVEDIVRCAEITHKHDLPARFSFIYGFPGETLEEIQQTKALIEKLTKLSNISISGPKLYTPYPGTVMYQTALEYGFKPPDTLGWANIHRATDRKYLPWLPEGFDG